MKWVILFLFGLAFIGFAGATASGDSSTTAHFSISGCELEGITLSAGSCSSSGNYYCGKVNGKYKLYNTLNDNLGCSKGVNVIPSVNQQCCPKGGYLCGKNKNLNTGQDEITCSQRTESCVSQSTENDCAKNGCSWINGDCVANPKDYSCSIYKTGGACTDDNFSLGQIGVGTSVCGTSFTVNGSLSSISNCHCGWTGSECRIDYNVSCFVCPTAGGGDKFSCSKGFNIGNCTKGVQLVKWDAIVKVVSGYNGGVPQTAKEKSGCVSNAAGTERDCGSPIVKLPGFGLFALLSSIGIVGLYYFFRKD